jgi:ABC-type phosphate/phosphonate transport system permease subunit
VSAPALAKMGRFLAELLQPETSPVFLQKLLWATLETLAMSALGTLLAVLLGLALALPASKRLRATRRAGAAPRGCCSTPCAAFPSWCGPRCC